eukprot:6550964-Ditylum_brightwellii.AAC.1
MEDDEDDKILFQNLEQCLETLCNRNIKEWKALNPDWDDGSTTNNNQPHSTADGPPLPIHSIGRHSIAASTMASTIHVNKVRVTRHHICGASLATDDATGAVTVVLGKPSPNYREILESQGSKADRAHLLAEAFQDALDEAPTRT